MNELTEHIEVVTTIIDTYDNDSLYYKVHIEEDDGRETLTSFVSFFKALRHAQRECDDIARDYEAWLACDEETRVLFEHSFPIVITCEGDFNKVIFTLTEREN